MNNEDPGTQGVLRILVCIEDDVGYGKGRSQ